MKKSVIITIVFIVIIFFSFCGCFFKTKQDAEYINPDGKLTLIPKTIDVVQGDTFILNLEANATTGFSWEVYIKDEKILKLTDRNYQADSADKDNIAVGSGGFETFSFKALNKGKTKLKLNYAQQWESGLNGETINITVIVE